MLTVELGYTINEDNSITWGSMYVHPATPIDSATIVDIYGDVMEYINNNPSIFTPDNLNSYSQGNPAYAVFQFSETFMYDGNTVTKLPELVQFEAVNATLMPYGWQ